MTWLREFFTPVTAIRPEDLDPRAVAAGRVDNTPVTLAQSEVLRRQVATLVAASVRTIREQAGQGGDDDRD